MDPRDTFSEAILGLYTEPGGIELAALTFPRDVWRQSVEAHGDGKRIGTVRHWRLFDKKGVCLRQGDARDLELSTPHVVPGQHITLIATFTLPDQRLEL